MKLIAAQKILSQLKILIFNSSGFTAHRINGERVNPSNLDRSSDDFEFPTKVFLEEETHSGEDVGIWAVGPWAHMYQGTIEQSIIPHVMAFASCIGNGKKSCDILDYSHISNWTMHHKCNCHPSADIIFYHINHVLEIKHYLNLNYILAYSFGIAFSC